MLSMVSGTVGFAPNPADGLIFLFEPSRGLAPTILQNTDELTSPPMKHTLFAIAAVLLFSAGDAVARRLGGEAADEALLQPLAEPQDERDRVAAEAPGRGRAAAAPVSPAPRGG